MEIIYLKTMKKLLFFFLLNSSFYGYKSDLISVGLLNDLTRVKKKRQFFVCVQSSSSFTIHGLLRVISVEIHAIITNEDLHYCTDDIILENFELTANTVLEKSDENRVFYGIIKLYYS